MFKIMFLAEKKPPFGNCAFGQNNNLPLGECSYGGDAIYFFHIFFVWLATP